MIKNNIIFIVILLMLGVIFYSCTKDNPIGPAIKQTWGTYDYFAYGLYKNWQYQENYPNIDMSYELWLYVFGQEYIIPHKGWQVGIIIDGVPTPYYFLDYVSSDAMYNCNPYGRVWWLMYEIPFVLGNRWHSETISKDYYDVEWKQTLDAVIIGWEDISVEAGDFEDCVKIKVTVFNSLVDTSGGDSSYFYEQEEWFAPNVGLVKWINLRTDVEDWKNASGVLKKKFHQKYGASVKNFCVQDMKKVNNFMRNWIR